MTIIDELRARIRSLNYEIEDEISSELWRINRPITLDDLSEKPFPFSENKNFFKLYLNDEGQVMLSEEQSAYDECLCTHLQAVKVPHWRLLRLLDILQQLPSDPHPFYKLRSATSAAALNVRITDLIPLKTHRPYSHEQLCKFLNYKDYIPDWERPMDTEHDRLYAIPENKEIDFFKIRGSSIVLIPGTYLYPTQLLPTDEMFIKKSRKSINHE